MYIFFFSPSQQEGLVKSKPSWLLWLLGDISPWTQAISAPGGGRPGEEVTLGSLLGLHAQRGHRAARCLAAFQSQAAAVNGWRQ